MNKDRRRELADIAEQLEIAKDEIENVKSEEEEALYNLPDQFQISATGEKIQGNIDEMDDAISTIDEVIMKLTNM